MKIIMIRMKVGKKRTRRVGQRNKLEEAWKIKKILTWMLVESNLQID